MAPHDDEAGWQWDVGKGRGLLRPRQHLSAQS